MIRFTPCPKYVRCILFLSLWAVFGFSGAAQAQSKTSFKQLLQAGQQKMRSQSWKEALTLFQKALKSQRGKPLYQKAPAYLYIGSCLYHMRHKGLAWKAFEQALYQNIQLRLPGQPSTELKAFFERVRKRVSLRGGQKIIQGTTAHSSSSSSSSNSRSGLFSNPWPWLVMTLSAGLVVGGTILVVGGTSSQADLDQWTKDAGQNGLAPQGIEGVKKNIGGNITGTNVFGFSMLGLGVAGAATAVVWLLLPKKSVTQTASKRLFPSTPHSALTHTRPSHFTTLYSSTP